MKTDQYAAVLALTLLAAGPGSAQQVSLVAWDHTWAFMQPMGDMPNVPPGGDADFDTTWYFVAGGVRGAIQRPAFSARCRNSSETRS